MACLYISSAFVGGITILGIWIWNRHQKSKGLPPGPFYWPFLGHLPQIMMYGKRPMFQVAMELRKKYGDVFLMKLGTVRLVWVSGLEKGREVLVHRKEDFDYRPSWLTLTRETNRTEGFTYNIGDSYVPLKRILQQATNKDGVGDKPLETRIIEEASYCIKALGEIAESGKEVYPEKIFKTFSLNLLYGVIFGKRLQYGDDLLSTWVTLIQEMKLMSRTTLLADILPCLSFLPPARTNKELLKKLVFVRQMIKDSIKEHEQTFNPRNLSDLIDLYIEAKRTGDDLTDLNVCGLILDSLYADTTGDKFMWLIAYMMKYEEVLVKCREEMDKKIQHERYVTSDDIPRLPYTYATMYEALRYGGTQITIPHAALNDTDLGGYTIPKNTIVIVNLASIHLDPTLFEDPLAFRPERFLDDKGKFRKLDHYNPFGIGTRKCTSWDMADRSMFVFFTNVMRRFDFVTPEGRQPVDLRGIQVAPHIAFKPKPFLVKLKKI